MNHKQSQGRDNNNDNIDTGEHRPAKRLEQTSDDTLPTASQRDGYAWGDMAILCADAPYQRKLPFKVRKRTGEYNPAADTIQIMTMKVSKGLEFPVVVLPDVGHMPAKGEDEPEAARVIYVAATRATQRLVIEVGQDGGFGVRLRCLSAKLQQNIQGSL